MTEFNKGHDVIYLADIDANTSDGDNNVFTFIDTVAFSDTTSGSRHFKNASNPIVKGDVDGDRVGRLPDCLPGGYTLKDGDFVL